MGLVVTIIYWSHMQVCKGASGSLGVLATATVSVSGRRKEGGITNVIPPTRRFGSSRVDPGAQKNTARADPAR